MSTVYTTPAARDERWHYTPADSRAKVHVIGADERWEVLGAVHLAFPGLALRPNDIREDAVTGTWTFPLPRTVYDFIHYNELPFTFIQYDDDDEPELSFVITPQDLVRS